MSISEETRQRVEEARDALNSTKWWQWGKRNDAARWYRVALFRAACEEMRNKRDEGGAAMTEPLEGTIHTPDFERWAGGMVESTTEYDWAEVPPPLRRRLLLWCADFAAWTAVGTPFRDRVAEADEIRKQVRG